MFCGLKMGHKVQNKVFLIANLKSFSIFSHHALEKKIFLLSARDQCAFPPNFRFFHNLGQCGVAAGPGPKFPVNNSPKGRKRTEVVDIYDFHLFEDCIQFSCSNLGQQMFFVTLFSFLNSQDSISYMEANNQQTILPLIEYTDFLIMEIIFILKMN